MSKTITIDEVKKLALLSQISITDDEAVALAAQMNEIVSYVQQLEEVDTTGVEPTSQVTGLVNANREDGLVDYKTRPEELLAQAPKHGGGYIKTKRVL